MVAGVRARGKSELHRARVPGESRGGASASTVQIGALRRESNRDHSASGFGWWLKRAILPAAISDSAASRLLAEAESREQSSPCVMTGRKTERDDHQEQNSAYSPFTSIVRCP